VVVRKIRRSQKSETHSVDGTVGEGGQASSISNGVEAKLNECSSAGDNSRSKSSNALCLDVSNVGL
jgi:hypothetical protein